MREWTEIYHINMLQNDLADKRSPLPGWLKLEECAGVQRLHQSMPQYAPTPLLSLGELAREGGARAVLIKDEAQRFGLNAFKALGSSYAIAQLIRRHLGIREEPSFGELQKLGNKLADLGFVTATDGNHGRGVAWVARQFGCPARVFMPAGTEAERVEAIRGFGAEVTVTEVSYDETVALAAAEAEKRGWLLVQDTSWSGYEETPKLIIQGYSTIAAELAEQCGQQGLAPTHIFLQAGVGSMAGGMLAFMQQLYPAARFIILEPRDVACCYKAAKLRDDRAAVRGVQRTIMAGLNCGTPCSVIMPVLRQRAEFFLGCPDFVAAEGMRLANKPLGTDPKFISGESGAISLGIISLLLRRAKLAELREALGIDASSVLLGINTEGAMAPRVWREVVEHAAYPLPQGL